MNKLQETVMDLLQQVRHSEWFEFKVDYIDMDELGRDISALSNSAALAGRKDAYLVLGVDGRRNEVIGTEFNYYAEENGVRIKAYLTEHCSPEGIILCGETSVKGRRVVVFTITAAANTPTSFNGERFVFIGSERKNLSDVPDKESLLLQILKNGLPSVINTPSSWQDFTFERLCVLYSIKGIRMDSKTVGNELPFHTDDGRYNILAQLLSDNSHVSVRVSVYSGKTRDRKPYINKEFGNTCLLFSIIDVLNYGDMFDIPITVNEEKRIVEREEIPLFDLGVYREAVLNAFVHNRWIDMVSPVIEFFTDRVEVASYGGLASSQTLNGFLRGETKPVNRELYDIVYQFYPDDKSGGVPRITGKYGTETFEFREDSIIVTIPFFTSLPLTEASCHYPPVSPAPEQNTVIPTSPASVAGPRLNNTQKKIFEIMRNDPYITGEQIQKKLHLGRSTVEGATAALKGFGKIERIGAKKNGYWKVNG
jgi:ATP-dependent DNA helicase RecG